MDADTLRLILFLAGIILILGIYLWDRHKRAARRVHAIRREKAEPQQVEETPAEAEQESRMPRHEPVWRRDGGEAADDAAPPPEEDPAAVEEALKQLQGIVQEEGGQAAVVQEEQITFEFGEPEAEAGTDGAGALPPKILQLNIRVRGGGRVDGPRILAAAEKCGLQPGDMQIFHRPARAGGQPLFSMASLVEPGVFPFDRMDGFSTPGVTLFAQLPGPMEAMQTFDEMLTAAQRLAADFGAEIQDETHSDLSRQTIEHIREEIQEYGRQLRLARSRR